VQVFSQNSRIFGAKTQPTGAFEHSRAPVWRPKKKPELAGNFLTGDDFNWKSVIFGILMKKLGWLDLCRIWADRHPLLPPSTSCHNNPSRLCRRLHAGHNFPLVYLSCHYLPLLTPFPGIGMIWRDILLGGRLGMLGRLNSWGRKDRRHMACRASEKGKACHIRTCPSRWHSTFVVSWTLEDIPRICSTFWLQISRRSHNPLTKPMHFLRQKWGKMMLLKFRI